jgi:hypothetical protein
LRAVRLILEYEDELSRQIAAGRVSQADVDAVLAFSLRCCHASFHLLLLAAVLAGPEG